MRIKTEDLELSFGKNKILKDLNFSADEGTLLGVIGPNGSGKTTLLRTISRVLEPSNGVIFLNGREISELSLREIAKDLAVVPQDTLVNFDFTAFEIVLMGRTPHIGRLKGETERDISIAREAIEQTGMDDFVDRPITTLSGGERQKIVIAKALAQEPRILLLDEPTSNLDIRNQIEIMELIKGAVLQKNITSLMSIHDINLAARYCDEIMLLKMGRIFAKGTPEKVLTRENIKEVFGVESIINFVPGEGSLYIVPLP